MSDQWCGCDGEGMAHIPGAEGFNCHEITRLKARLAAAEAKSAELEGLLEWRTMDTAPKGYPAIEQPSEWFLVCGRKGPNDFNIAVIRRCFGHGFGPWECSGDAYYKADFFTHWMPIPSWPCEALSTEPKGEQ